MNKKYLLIVFIVIILYLLFLIINYKYKEYNFNNYISYLNSENVKVKEEIASKVATLENVDTKAYKNKFLKETQNMKNKWEKVIYITKEDIFNTFTQTNTNSQILWENIETPKEENIVDSMTTAQKWYYFLFGKMNWDFQWN